MDPITGIQGAGWVFSPIPLTWGGYPPKGQNTLYKRQIIVPNRQPLGILVGHFCHKTGIIAHFAGFHGFGGVLTVLALFR